MTAKNLIGKEEFVFSNSFVNDQITSKIYIRTKFAWYILGIPNASYAPFYIPFWTQHRILHILVAMSLENKRTTYKDLVDNLKEMDNLNNSITTARLLLGRDLRKIDIETDDVVSSIIIIIIFSILIYSLW